VPVSNRAVTVLAAMSLVTVLAACSHGAPAARPTITVTTTAQPPASPAASAVPVPPGIVAVTAGGALVVLDPATGTVSRGGVPVQNTSRLMWEVSRTGALVHQVAIGFASLAHTSLAVSPDGNWLLYLAGHDLYVSPAGATPAELTSGLTAAAWS
jgi:hypothetical protein